MKKIRIERVSIGSIAVTILLGILLVFVSSECTQQFAALQTATDEYIECENQASELQAASDYLAEQVRLFVVTGQREYMDLYFEEKNVTRRQEKAFAYLEQEFDGTTSSESLKTALNSTKNLSYADRYAMRLAAEAYIADGESWPEAIQAVADAKRGGIRTVMITGDHRVTASAIARQIGILQDGELALSGHELDEMDDGALDQKLEQVSVYARVSPEHKIRIVEAWKRRGKIVAMTGDGVNDAPALKSADIGVAMGVTGTEVSKDAAAMILADDNFATIVKAVVNGRGVYTNIKNAITFLLSGNMAGILSVLVPSILGLPNPFLPVHLLFINLLTDSLPAIAIGVEPSSGDMLSQKPRDPSEPILNWSLLGRIGIYGLLIAAATMAAYFLGLNSGGAPLAMTLAFATLTGAGGMGLVWVLLGRKVPVAVAQHG